MTHPAGTPPAHQNDPLALPGGYTLNEYRFERVLGCLLYTSDAADE